MGQIAVIDTETNWYDQVMSVGVAAADSESFRLLAGKYYILEPECRTEGMYSDRLHLVKKEKTIVCSRQEAMGDLVGWLRQRGITGIFAYNARFDCHHLPELGEFCWYDIMKLAAYRQFNETIPEWESCCTTGRLKRNYGVEPTLQRLRGEKDYRETHNALLDAVDELQIMQLLSKPVSCYEQWAKV